MASGDKLKGTGDDYVYQWQDVVALALVAAAATYAGRALWRMLSGKSGKHRG